MMFLAPAIPAPPRPAAKQFSKQYLMQSIAPAAAAPGAASATITLPAAAPVGSYTINWVQAGFSTPVRDQMACGECEWNQGW